MPVTVQLTYEMRKALGVPRVEVEGARTVADVVRITRERFGPAGERFDELTRLAAVAVNGILASHRRGIRTPVANGDVVAFVKAAAGG
jgi:molybdopterin converting factor small subunit